MMWKFVSNTNVTYIYIYTVESDDSDLRLRLVQFLIVHPLLLQPCSTASTVAAAFSSPLRCFVGICGCSRGSSSDSATTGSRCP